MTPRNLSARSATARDERVCRRITRRHARTFYFASACLPRATRMHAYAVYAFCRWADNGVDDARDPSEAVAKVDQARRVLELAYHGTSVPEGLRAFARTVHERAIPKPLFDALLDGMAMDLTQTRYPNFAALDLYCYRVAGVVGLMMTHVFGFTHERCLPRALALGTAMQLTNILRDIGEDWSKGRLYLPQDELAASGVSQRQIAEGCYDDRFRDFMRGQIDRARSYYAESTLGIPDLIGASSRLTVRVMGRVYGGILGAIERLDYDVFQTRAHVPTRSKLATLSSCLAETGWEMLRTDRDQSSNSMDIICSTPIASSTSRHPAPRSGGISTRSATTVNTRS